jgi:hypothetical protein
MAVIEAWMELGTRVISDCWAEYWTLDAQSYTHRTIYHSIGFGDQLTWAHAKTIETTLRDLKAFFSLTTGKVTTYAI